MKNGFLLFFSLIFTVSIHGQYQNNLLVEYTFYNNSTSIPLETKANLIGNITSSLYTVFVKQPKNRILESKTSDEGNTGIPGISQIIDVSDGKNLYVYKNLNDSKIIHTTSSNQSKTQYKIEESNPNFNWILINEEQKINGFTSKKATLSFRGRNYIAWYTTEIPMPFGPWKFADLPGLILDIYDETQTFRWTATTLKYPYHESLNAIEPNWESYHAVSLKNYIDINEKIYQESLKQEQSRLPSGARITSSSRTRAGIELVYEWEEVQN